MNRGNLMRAIRVIPIVCAVMVGSTLALKVKSNARETASSPPGTTLNAKKALHPADRLSDSRRPFKAQQGQRAPDAEQSLLDGMTGRAMGDLASSQGPAQIGSSQVDPTQDSFLNQVELDELMAHLSSEDMMTRSQAFRTLLDALMKATPEQKHAFLIRAQDHFLSVTADYARSSLLTLVGKVGEEAVPFLASVADENPDPELREAAIKALGATHSETALPILMEIANSISSGAPAPYSEISLAIGSVSRIGGEAATQFILDFLPHEDYAEYIVLASAEALERQPDPRLVQVLRDGLNSDKPAVRSNALSGICSVYAASQGAIFSIEEVRPLLHQYLDPEQRDMASVSLLQLHGIGRAADVAALVSFVGRLDALDIPDDDPLRSLAMEALRLIEERESRRPQEEGGRYIPESKPLEEDL